MSIISKTPTVGLDEAGRGSWAGPLVVSLVSFGLKKPPRGLTDSKLLKPTQRLSLFDLIQQTANYIGVGVADNHEVDDLGLTKATILAVHRALNDIDLSNYQLIIDGNVDYLPQAPNKKLVVKADLKYPCVSAASIIAKVSRDKMMTDLSKQYLGYGFEQHKGYGTAAHKKALGRLGPCALHRRSYKPIKLLFSD